MREILHNTMIHSRRVADLLAQQMRKGNQLTDDELLTRYTREHRGNARAMAAFITQHMPPGRSPLAEMKKYETAMEQKLAARGATLSRGASEMPPARSDTNVQ